MTRARDIADLVDANGDVVAGALDNVAPSNDASALTTGTLPSGRFPATLPAVSGANLTGIPIPTLSSLGIANHDQVTVTAGGAVTATSFSGNGSSLTGIPTPTLSSLGITNHDQLTVAANGDVTIGGTGAITVPAGTTAQRPTSPVAGMVRRNTSHNEMEFYDGTNWFAFTQQAAGVYGIDYIVVGGGGGAGSGTTGQGARYQGGGGGGGGVASGSSTLNIGSTHTIVVGAGAPQFTAGGNSSGFAVTVNGGSPHNGQAGGASGAPTSFGGGGASTYGGGGGGGASAVGGSGSGTHGAGNGGAGLLVSNFQSSGESGYFAGGGGGGGGGVGGIGGGGDSDSNNGTVNTGGGGGGGYGVTGVSASGGSGVVIIRYSGSQKGTGGTVTSTGGYTYHTFSSSGTFTA